MDDITISELDESQVRALGVRCALESFLSREASFTCEELIACAQQIEFHIDEGSPVRFTCHMESTRKAAGG